MSPATLTAEYLVERWPRLYHMAEADSWPSIHLHGLLSTTALLDLFEVEGAEREAIESQRRPETVRIEHPQLGEAWIRDNKPINETVLARTLVGMTERDWYHTLNSRVFFWLSEARLDRLRNAPPYRAREHDVLIIDTATLWDAYGPVVELSPLNSGAVHPAADYPRGAGTFSVLNDYPWEARRQTAPGEPIVELTVPYRVADVDAMLIDVRRM